MMACVLSAQDPLAPRVTFGTTVVIPSGLEGRICDLHGTIYATSLTGVTKGFEWFAIDNDGLHAPRERTGSVALARGVHDVRVSYFQGPRYQVALVLKIAPPGEEMRIFNTDELRPPASYTEK